MTNPIDPNIKNTGVSPDASDPLEDAYGYEYDPELEGEGDVMGDEGFMDAGGDATGYSSGPTDVAGMRSWLNGLLADGAISQTEHTNFMTRANSSLALSPENQAASLAQIANDVNAAIAPPPPAAVEGEEGVAGADDPFAIDEALEGTEDGGMATEIQDFINRVESNDSLSRSAKKDFVDEAEKLLADLELIGDDDGAQIGIEEKFTELQENYSTFLALPEGIHSLATRYGKDVSEITALADQHGVDLANLAEPPTQNVLEFLADLDPAIASAQTAVQDAIRNKKDLDEEMTRRATADSSNNKRGTSNTDTIDFAAFDYLSHARYYEDSGSWAIAEANSNLVTKLTEGLRALYPDASINSVGTDYEDSDLIRFGSNTIDVIANKTGDFLAGSEGGDSNLEIPEMVTLEYDMEGSGHWDDIPASGTGYSDAKEWMNHLKDEGYPTHNYDD